MPLDTINKTDEIYREMMQTNDTGSVGFVETEVHCWKFIWLLWGLGTMPLLPVMPPLPWSLWEWTGSNENHTLSEMLESKRGLKLQHKAFPDPRSYILSFIVLMCRTNPYIYSRPLSYTLYNTELLTKVTFSSVPLHEILWLNNQQHQRVKYSLTNSVFLIYCFMSA